MSLRDNNGRGGGDYEVGYGKPPKEHQFKEGQSGNGGGRPKGTKNLKTDLLEEMRQVVRLRENGKDIRISKQRALLKSLMARALHGNDRATGQLLDLYMKVGGLENEAQGAGVPLTRDEQDILDGLKKRLLAQLKDGGDNE